MHCAFGIASLMAILSTVLVVTGTNAVHALICLILSLLSVAVLLFLLGAPFAAALEVILYAGAIMVMFVFVVMTLNTKESVREEKGNLRLSLWIPPLVLTTILFGEIFYVISRPASIGEANFRVIDPKTVGLALFGPYLLAVEAGSLLLLGGLLGAYHLARRGRRDSGGAVRELPKVKIKEGGI